MNGEIESKAGVVTGFSAASQAMEARLVGWLAVGDRIRVREPKARSEDPQALRLKFEMTVGEIQHLKQSVQRARPGWTVRVGRLSQLAASEAPKDRDLVFRVRVLDDESPDGPPIKPPPPVSPPGPPPEPEPEPPLPPDHKDDDGDLPDPDDFEDDEDDEDDDRGSKAGRIGG